MRFLPEYSSTADIDNGLKNKWHWEWLKERDSSGREWSEWLKKRDVRSVSYCESCGKTIKYGSIGKKAMKTHANDATHLKNHKIVQQNQVLPGSGKSSMRVESMPDRIGKQNALTAAFLSEHCLPFTLAEDLLGYAKCLSEDKRALNKTSISHTSATYINTHGVAKCFKDELAEKLKDQPISLNIDEATNNNNDKILNIIVQYYDTEQGRVVIDHLGSRKQNQATALNILSSVQHKDRTKLTVKNYEAVADVKTALKRKNTTATKLEITPKMKSKY